MTKIGYWDRDHISPDYKYDILKNRETESSRVISFTKAEFITWYNSQRKLCYYCSQPFVFEGNSGDSITIDRKDNTQDYVLSNMVLSCRRCNGSKGNHPYPLSLRKGGENGS